MRQSILATRWWARAAATLVAAVLSPAAFGQTRGTDGRTPLPADPALWVNAAPLSLEQLDGKAAFLWFYEEDCPRCREKWPMLLSLSRRFADEPIVFIAVNSGTSRGEVEAYARQNKIHWPIVVDPAREFEKAADVGEISLQNIHQVRVIGPDGSMRGGRWDAIEETVTAALQGAKWKVDPKGIPDSLKPAWTAIELGSYAEAAANVRKSLNSPKADLKSAAEKLQAYVQAQIDKLLEEAKTAGASDDKWKAYKAYATVAERFKGYELPDDVETQRKALSNDAAVKEQLAALKVFDAASKQLGSSAPAQRKRGQTTLEKLVREKPDTEAAAKAQAALQRAGL